MLLYFTCVGLHSTQAAVSDQSEQLTEQFEAGNDQWHSRVARCVLEKCQPFRFVNSAKSNLRRVSNGDPGKTERQSILLSHNLICLCYGWLITFRCVCDVTIAPWSASTAANMYSKLR